MMLKNRREHRRYKRYGEKYIRLFLDLKEEKERKTWGRSLFERLTAGIFPILMKDIKPHIQEALKTANKIKIKKTKTEHKSPWK